MYPNTNLMYLILIFMYPTNSPDPNLITADGSQNTITDTLSEPPPWLQPLTPCHNYTFTNTTHNHHSREYHSPSAHTTTTHQPPNESPTIAQPPTHDNYISLKRCQKRRTLPETEKKDRISNLPNEVLGRILSLLPTKYAVATSILSSSWRNLYQLSSNLDFDDSLLLNPQMRSSAPDRHTRFSTFVDQVLVKCSRSQISRFRLKSGKHVGYSHFTLWVLFALTCFSNMTELELTIKWRRRYVLQFPNSTCENLVTLKLDSSCMLHGEYNFADIKGILKGCQLLEELVIIGCDWNGSKLSFRNLLLRKLTLDLGLGGILEQLNESKITFNLPSGYNEDIFEDDQYLCDTMLSLIVGVKNCECLYLSGLCLRALTRGEFELPVFENLTRLKLHEGFGATWNDVLLEFLDSSPRLEVLTLVQDDGRNDDFILGNYPVPSCVSSQLKVINLEYYTGSRMEIGMVKYFLKNANLLEQMVIHRSQSNTARETEKLNLMKASEACSISFKILMFDK
ncbi:hypothetical protein RND81_09G038100 [Saponaria officinalis]|uniref:F-box domain-containing protein n=1 Tax=Saponaria officinalis TaxID=3572 RepID=A0AAW1IHN8_SAPOF